MARKRRWCILGRGALEVVKDCNTGKGVAGAQNIGTGGLGSDGRLAGSFQE